MKVKKNMRFKNNVLPLLLGLFALALFIACSQESSTEDGETKQAIKDNKPPFNPKKLRVEITKCNINYWQKYNDSLSWENIYSFRGDIDIKFTVDIDGKITFDKTSEPNKLVFNSAKKEPENVYLFIIDYVDDKDARFNWFLMENDLDYKYQNFFLYYPSNGDSKEWATDRSKVPYEYAYADKYKEKNSIKPGPVGITGFIHFLKPHTKFDLTIGLFYSGKKTKFDADGKTSPFWTPSPELLKKGEWLSKFKIPIEVKD